MEVHRDAEAGVGGEVRDHFRNDSLDLVWQRAAVRVAEHQSRRTGLRGTFENPQAELGVAAVAVEEVLGVVEHRAPFGSEELDGVGHHRDALVERGLQRFEHVIVGCLSDDAHRARVRIEQVAQRVVGIDLALRATGRAERDEGARVQREVARRAREQLVVLRIGARPTGFDVVDAEPVELLGDAQLVVDGERDALELAPVAQRRVVHLDLLDAVAH